MADVTGRPKCRRINFQYFVLTFSPRRIDRHSRTAISPATMDREKWIAEKMISKALDSRSSQQTQEA